MATKVRMVEQLSPETYRTVLESLPTGVYLVDRDRRILLWSSGAEELTGFLRQEVIGRACRDDLLIHCDEEHTCLCDVACPVQETINDGRPRTADMLLLHKDGSRVPVTVRTAPLRDERGFIIGAVECFETRLVIPIPDPLLRTLCLADAIDATTGLPDRRATETRLQAYLGAYEKSPVPFGILCIAVEELDQLRHLDGRNAVDAVLRATGQTLAANLSPNDLVGRWSDTRFLAVVTGCGESALQAVVERLKRLVHLEQIPWWGDRLTINLSVGSTLVQFGDTPESLAGRAEAALENTVQHCGNGKFRS